MIMPSSCFVTLLYVASEIMVSSSWIRVIRTRMRTRVNKSSFAVKLTLGFDLLMVVRLVFKNVVYDTTRDIQKQNLLALRSFQSEYFCILFD